MVGFDVTDFDEILRRIRSQAKNENLRVTQHAQQEMVEEGFTLNNVLEAISAGKILENYPDHKRGACCLVNGLTHEKRPAHIVCTTTWPMLIIVTVYEPKPPKWKTPTQRSQ